MKNTPLDFIVILGPTASGKTTLAVKLAEKIDGEIISADSRQVYKKMDIGTGKDLSEYSFGSKKIKYHLIDICEPGEKYNLARFQFDFKKALVDVKSRAKTPILCGGSGLYIQSIIGGFSNTQIPENALLRNKLSSFSKQQLLVIFQNFHSEECFDLSTLKRLIRAIEILTYKKENPEFEFQKVENYKFKIFGLNPDTDLRRNKISERLWHRINHQGLIEEVKSLISDGLSFEMLNYYGLEYKYLGMYLSGNLNFDGVITQLETEIHRYAKRQMTFFRSLERKGFEINWIPDNFDLEKKVVHIRNRINN